MEKKLHRFFSIYFLRQPAEAPRRRRRLSAANSNAALIIYEINVSPEPASTPERPPEQEIYKKSSSARRPGLKPHRRDDTAMPRRCGKRNIGSPSWAECNWANFHLLFS